MNRVILTGYLAYPPFLGRKTPAGNQTYRSVIASQTNFGKHDWPVFVRIVAIGDPWGNVLMSMKKGMGVIVEGILKNAHMKRPASKYHELELLIARIERGYNSLETLAEYEAEKGAAVPKGAITEHVASEERFQEQFDEEIGGVF